MSVRNSIGASQWAGRPGRGEHTFPRKGISLLSLSILSRDMSKRGVRPALVVSNTLFNQQTGLAMVCPLTTTDRGYPFHVSVTKNSKVKGIVMVEQVKSIDYEARQAKNIGKASDDLLDEVLSILDACIY
jgi:mRNA interferase MazF